MPQLAQPHPAPNPAPNLATGPAPNPAPASFSAMLAALTAPPVQPAKDKFEPLTDDVTLSYESALRARASYLPVYRPETPGSATGTRLGGRAGQAEATPTFKAEDASTSRTGNPAQPGLGANSDAGLEPKFKRASVTLRMSKSERAQLQQRAGEAALTLSAYLRSCAFEVEGLRFQVKQALAELRAAKAAQELAARRRRWPHLFRRGT